MAIEIHERQKIKLNSQDNTDSFAKRKRYRKINKFIAFIIFLAILLLPMICYKLADIGFNAVEAWEIDKIELTEENLQILNDTKLNIFSGLKNNKIKPKSNGTYRFSVKNKSNYDMIYNIRFEADMENYINIKYKLKIDNIYVRGNNNTYVSIDELDLESIIVPKDSINVYTLEWYWEDDDENDTKVASIKEDQYYNFRMQITSNIYEK